MPYKVIEIFNDLPKTNCKECGKPGCYQFALGVYLNELELESCTQLEADKLSEMQAKLAEGKQQGEGVAPPNHQQALTRLYEVMAEADLSKLAKNSGCNFDGEIITVELFGENYQVKRNSVTQPPGKEENVWEKVLILLYLTMSKGTESIGQWVSFKELPNTISKAKNFEDECEKLAGACDEMPDKLEKALSQFSATKLELESVDLAYEIKALPKVTVRLLYWQGDDDFASRCSILLDKGVLDYLDQEASVFLAEVLVNKIIKLMKES